MTWRLFLFCILLLCLSVSCSDRPEGVPKSKEMVEVLYDYHLADAMAMQKGDNTAFTQQIYTDAALKKHGLTREQFHQSLLYYEKHSKKLLAIYQRVEMRLAEMAPGVNGADVVADSADNIWNDRASYVLMANNMNRLSFEMAAPKTVKAGCFLEWTFNVQWLYREGTRSADVLLVLVYEGDSIVTHQQQLFGSGKQKISVSVGDKSLKYIKGLIYQDAAWSPKPKIMYLSSMGLFVREDASSKPQLSPTSSTAQEVRMRHLQRNDTTSSDTNAATVSSSVSTSAPDFTPKQSRLSKSEQDILDSVRKKEGRDQPHFK